MRWPLSRPETPRSWAVRTKERREQRRFGWQRLRAELGQAQIQRRRAIDAGEKLALGCMLRPSAWRWKSVEVPPASRPRQYGGTPLWACATRGSRGQTRPTRWSSTALRRRSSWAWQRLLSLTCKRTAMAVGVWQHRQNPLLYSDNVFATLAR